jgi:hypothetical protein
MATKQHKAKTNSQADALAAVGKLLSDLQPYALAVVALRDLTARPRETRDKSDLMLNELEYAEEVIAKIDAIEATATR